MSQYDVCMNSVDDTPPTHSLTMGGQGQLVVPAELRVRHGLEAGTKVTLIETDDALLILTPAQLRKQTQRTLAEADLTDGQPDDEQIE